MRSRSLCCKQEVCSILRKVSGLLIEDWYIITDNPSLLVEKFKITLGDNCKRYLINEIQHRSDPEASDDATG